MKPKKLINDLINNGDISNALLIFNDSFGDSIVEKELRMVTAMFNRAKRECISGTISDDRYNLELNKITSKLIDLLDQITIVDEIKSFKRSVKFQSELGFFNAKKIRINETGEFRFNSFPSNRSGLQQGGEYEAGEEFLINSTLIKVYNSGTIQSSEEEMIRGVGFGEVDFLSKERFFNAVQASNSIDCKQGDKLEYLCPIDEEKCIIKMWDNVIVINKTKGIDVIEEPILEIWNHATLPNGHRLGWLQLDNRMSIF